MNEDIKEQLKKELKQEMKQEKKKKRMIISIILLIIAGIIIFIVCNAYKKVELHKPKIISNEEFSQYITEIPVTTENWKEYFECKDITKEEKDAFGEVTGIAKLTQLKLKDNIYGYLILKFKIDNNLTILNRNEAIITVDKQYTNINDFASLKNKSNDKNVFDFTISMNELNCIQVKGNLYKIDLPDDIWQDDGSVMTSGKMAEDGKAIQIEERKHFNVGTENDYKTYWEYTYMDTLFNEEYQKYTENK